ncbi:hypothetical protein [Caballeronia zhejiangensis]|uniref:Uncharacterized protein n=1 Tax=Caballeronia zhejiangensis TaxID=871203 RepID=A0A656QA50_9BURK|nr:hypothetical protein [Caballeronia zhejiangensis]KDR25968.1 hypothetical protein BG60_26525 [Caballeronia zhejiangensis]
MGFNLGAFGGGLSSGINNGISLGAQIQAAKDAAAIRDLQQKGMEEAQQARQDQIDKSIAATGIKGSADPTVATDNASAAAANTSPALGGLMAGADPSQSPAAQMPQQTDVSAKGSTPQFSTTAPTYAVNGKEVGDYDTARAVAEKSAPSTMDLFIKNSVPKVAAAYLAQGDAQKAQAWNDWADQTKNKQHMRTWAQAYQAAQAGDMGTAVDKMVSLYNDNVDDGISVTSKNLVKDQDGSTHYEIGLKDSKGNEWTQKIDQRTLIEQGMAGLSPDKQFEMVYKRQTDADVARAKAAAEEAHDQRVFGRDIKKIGVQAKVKEVEDKRAHEYKKDEEAQKQGFEIARDDRKAQNESDLEDKKSGNRMAEDNNKAQVEVSTLGAKEKAKVSAKIDALKAAGYDDDSIKGMMPMLLNAESYKKPTSPGEARRMAFDARMKNDFSFGHKSPEEQNRIIEGDIAIINGTGVKSGAPSKSGSTTANPFNPAAGGLGASAPAAASPAAGAQSKGIPVYDSKTGQIVYR